MPFRPKDTFKSNADSESTKERKRIHHNVQASSYWLPNDDIEQDRLNEMYFALKHLYSGQLLPKVKEILDFNSNLKVLDLGCATGAWILETSVEYPNCDYYGVDISSNFPALSPNNTHFMLHNVIDGLPFVDSYFDYVRLGHWTSNLKEVEWPPFLKEVYRVMKPGALMLNLEIDTMNHTLDATGSLTALYMVNKINKMYPDLVSVLPGLLKNAGFTTILTDKRSLGYLIGPALGMSAEEYIASTPKLIQKAKDNHAEWTYVAFLSQKPKKK
ncbi:S-adenosyl-L-methionine-dependent methyltransferase [Phycomyces blakesleeanus]